MKALHIPLSEKIKAKVHCLLHKEIKAPSEETMVKCWMAGILVTAVVFIICLVYMGFVVYKNEAIHGRDMPVIVILDRSGRSLIKRWRKYTGKS